MHRLRVPVEYLAAALLAVGLAGGFFALRESQDHNTPAASPPAVKSGSSAPPASPAAARARAPRGVQLLSELRRAYEHVPAVIVSGSLGAMSVRFTEILDHGKGRAEAFIGGPPGQTTRLVAPEGEPTFAQAPGTSCWHVLPHSAP